MVNPKARRALMISPEPPYPLDGGGPLRTASLLHFLAARYEVDLVAFRHPGQQVAEAIPAGLVRNVHTIDLRHHQNDPMSRSFRNARRLVQRRPPLLDRFGGYEDRIASLTADSVYDVAVLEHFWAASYLPLVQKFARRTVLDLHNIDSAWHGSCARSSGFPRSLIHRAFAASSRSRERELLGQCDLALVTSAEDMARAQEIAPDLSVCVYPNAIPRREPLDIEPDFAIAFSGNMEYEPNRTGLKFFLTQVWPELSAKFPQLVFRIVGKNDHAIRADIRGSARVETTGPVEDTFDHISRAMISIAPLFSGSGTRLKIIEAWAARRPVVSTRFGAEGLGAVHSQSILFADTPVDFIGAIEALISQPDLRERIAMGGRSLFHTKFTWDSAWALLTASLS